MYCKKCGTYNSNNNLRCKKCGDYIVNQYLNDSETNYTNGSIPTETTNNEINEKNKSPKNNNRKAPKRKSIKKKRKNKNQLLKITKKEKNNSKKKTKPNPQETEVITKTGCLAQITILFLSLLVLLLIGVCSILGLYILKDKIVLMPDLINLSKEEAITILKENELNYKTTEETVENKNKINTVISQDKKAGKYILKSKTVTITIGTIKNTEVPKKSPNTITLDNLIGMTKEQAIAILEKNNINYTIEEIESTENNNLVIEQNPIYNTKITTDTIVTIYISKNTNNTSKKQNNQNDTTNNEQINPKED